MMTKIVLLSGHVGSGKTTLARLLQERYGIRHLKTREIIRKLSPQVESSREAMQREGRRLDRTTGGRWVSDGLVELVMKGERQDEIIVVDAVRIPNQIARVKEAFERRVLHIHLTAPKEVLAQRYSARPPADGFTEFTSYNQVLADSTEAGVKRLERIADVVIDSNRCTVEDVLVRAACHMGLYPRANERMVDILVGGQYGSEGKGQIAAHLAPEYDLLVRVGGPNAGHTVLHDGVKAVFHHLPSGTVKVQTPIVLGPGSVLNVGNLLREIATFEVEYDRLSIDPQAMVISPSDIAGERLLQKRISSTGQGVGMATARKIIGRGDRTTLLAKDHRVLRPYIRPAREVLDAAFRKGWRVLLEGTQGAGLSLHHGPYPHVTSRDTCVAGCLAEAGISPSRVRKVIMTCRTYPIRVADPPGRNGATSGGLRSLDWDEVSRRSGIPESELRNAELTTTTKRPRRVGEFEWDSLRRSASLNAPTDIALTFTDYISIENRRAVRFEQLTQDTIRFIQEVECVAGAPVSLISTRFGGVIDRRDW